MSEEEKSEEIKDTRKRMRLNLKDLEVKFNRYRRSWDNSVYKFFGWPDYDDYSHLNDDQKALTHIEYAVKSLNKAIKLLSE